jgi:hypothetical protein
VKDKKKWHFLAVYSLVSEAAAYFSDLSVPEVEFNYQGKKRRAIDSIYDITCIKNISLSQ